MELEEMRKTALMLLFLPTLSLAQEPAPQTISITNTNSETHETWVSGEKVSLTADSGVLVPCLPEETFEVQQGEELVYVKCGAELEAKQ